jgi:hypothetical protein
VYFDDERWNVRYFVVDTGHVMPERRVLIAPGLLVSGQPSDKLIRVRLTRNEVERSPDVKTALPVALQFDLPQQRRAAADPHLRSGELVIGYQVGQEHRLVAQSGRGARARSGAPVAARLRPP